jgi:hypothetical protein
MRWLMHGIGLFLFASIIASTAACADEDEGGGETVAETATAALSEAVTAAELCGAAQASVAGTVANPDLVEISGLSSSRTQDVLWAHNDSGDTPRVFALRPSGKPLATYTLNGAEATDWEDMAIGAGPANGVAYLYMGDIGDNASIRPSITVYRIEEPTFDPTSSNQSADATAIVLIYPDGAHDAETLLADPENGDLYIITKNIAGAPAGVYRAGAPHDTTVPITLENVGTIDFAALAPTKVIPPESGALPLGLPKIPTGGEISADGRIIAVRTYGTVWLWDRAVGESVAEALAGEPCEGPSEVEPQGEAIAFAADGRGYITASEGANVPVYHITLP